MDPWCICPPIRFTWGLRDGADRDLQNGQADDTGRSRSLMRISGFDKVRRGNLPAAVCLLVFAALFGVFIHNIRPYFSASAPHLAEDYSYFLPALLNGYFWFMHNGPWAVPWFTPAICAGLPFVSNPQNLYYSVPQVLTLLVDPQSGVYLTILLFAAVGFWAFFLLCRCRFHMARPTALFAAACFLFNGFYTSHMLAGKLTFHSYMLVPAIALCLLLPQPLSRNPVYLRKAIAGTALAALMMGYLLLFE